MTDLNNWAVIVPAHNSALNILNTVDELAEYYKSNSLRGQVIIVENGSKDDTWEVMSSIDTTSLPFALVRTQSEKGLGNAIREGLSKVSTDYVLITADDLPFGFSDLNEFIHREIDADIAIGSKAHPDTAGTRSFSREVMSKTFRLLRRVVIHVNLGDTQGTILGKAAPICDLGIATRQQGYLMTTELLAIATQKKKSIIEIPVQFRETIRKSNVKIVSDSFKMFRGLFEVRRNL